MKKRLKRVYIEITNACNLSCSFCTKTKRTIQMMTPLEFQNILEKVNSYTDYIYLHVKGEPLLHPNLKEILELSNRYNKQVTITTNGTLLKEKKEILKNNPSIRQINLSLHSENKKENYLEDIFQVVDELSSNIYVVYRFWTLQDNKLDRKSTEIVNKIIRHHNLSTETVEKIRKQKNIKIAPNIYISKDNQFLWPELNNTYYQEEGYCHALKSQMAILVDGTIIPCCLDGEGVINLGNIHTDNLESVLESERVLQMIEGFKCRRVQEELCRHCNFKEKFDSKNNIRKESSC